MQGNVDHWLFITNWGLIHAGGSMRGAKPVSFIFCTSAGHEQVDIQGPIKISVLNDPENAGWELQLNYSDDFKSADLAPQGLCRLPDRVGK